MVLHLLVPIRVKTALLAENSIFALGVQLH